MADKSVPQLTAVTSTTSGDLYHVVRSNIDYKIDFDDLARDVRGGASSPIIYESTTSMSSAELLAGFTTPKLMVAAPAAGYAIEVISCSAQLTFVSAAYATNTAIIIYTDTATDNQFEFTAILASTATKTSRGILQGSGGTATIAIIAAKALYMKVKTGNPITGDGTLKVYTCYRLVRL